MQYITCQDQDVRPQNWFYQQYKTPENRLIQTKNSGRYSRQAIIFPDEFEDRRSSNQRFDDRPRPFRQRNPSRSVPNNNIDWERDRANSIQDGRNNVNDIFSGNNFNGGFRPRPTTPRPSATTVAIPGMGTTRSPCEDACLTTPEYNPVCGNNGITYFSMARLNCAIRCGRRKLHIFCTGFVCMNNQSFSSSNRQTIYLLWYI